MTISTDSAGEKGIAAPVVRTREQIDDDPNKNATPDNESDNSDITKKQKVVISISPPGIGTTSSLSRSNTRVTVSTNTSRSWGRLVDTDAERIDPSDLNDEPISCLEAAHQRSSRGRTHTSTSGTAPTKRGYVSRDESVTHESLLTIRRAKIEQSNAAVARTRSDSLPANTGPRLIGDDDISAHPVISAGTTMTKSESVPHGSSMGIATDNRPGNRSRRFGGNDGETDGNGRSLKKRQLDSLPGQPGNKGELGARMEKTTVGHDEAQRNYPQLFGEGEFDEGSERERHGPSVGSAERGPHSESEENSRKSKKRMLELYPEQVDAAIARLNTLTTAEAIQRRTSMVGSFEALSQINQTVSRDRKESESERNDDGEWDIHGPPFGRPESEPRYYENPDLVGQRKEVRQQAWQEWADRHTRWGQVCFDRLKHGLPHEVDLWKKRFYRFLDVNFDEPTFEGEVGQEVSVAADNNIAEEKEYKMVQMEEYRVPLPEGLSFADVHRVVNGCPRAAINFAVREGQSSTPSVAPPRPRQNPAEIPQRYSTDYSRFDRIQDSDSDGDPPGRGGNARVQPPLVRVQIENDRARRDEAETLEGEVTPDMLPPGFEDLSNENFEALAQMLKPTKVEVARANNALMHLNAKLANFRPRDIGSFSKGTAISGKVELDLMVDMTCENASRPIPRIELAKHLCEFRARITTKDMGPQMGAVKFAWRHMGVPVVLGMKYTDGYDPSPAVASILRMSSNWDPDSTTGGTPDLSSSESSDEENESNAAQAGDESTTVPLEVMAVGDVETFRRPCVDCGCYTSRFCDFCRANDRLPNEDWAEGQYTPFCGPCEEKRGRCHFCHDQRWAMPPPWGSKRVTPENDDMRPQGELILEPGAPEEPQDQWILDTGSQEHVVDEREYPQVQMEQFGESEDGDDERPQEESKTTVTDAPRNTADDMPENQRNPRKSGWVWNQRTCDWEWYPRASNWLCCIYCGKPSPLIPYPWCNFCQTGPSWHHGRCCPQAPWNRNRAAAAATTDNSDDAEELSNLCRECGIDEASSDPVDPDELDIPHDLEGQEEWM